MSFLFLTTCFIFQVIHPFERLADDVLLFAKVKKVYKVDHVLKEKSKLKNFSQLTCLSKHYIKP